MATSRYLRTTSCVFLICRPCRKDFHMMNQAPRHVRELMTQWLTAVAVSEQPTAKDVLKDKTQLNLMRGLGMLASTFGTLQKNSFSILMYHRLAPNKRELTAPTINVTPAQFEQQLTGLLENGFQFWSLTQAIQHRRQNQDIPDKVLVVTFDDAFECVYRYGVPIMRKLGVPATIFTNTAFIDQDMAMPFDLWGMKNANKAPSSWYRAMSTSQLIDLCSDPLFEVGAHTHTHRDFRNRNTAFKKDLFMNLQVLKDDFGIEKPSFAFPYGIPELGFVTWDMIDIARDLGVSCALSTSPRVIQPHTDAFGWGRFHVFPWDTALTIRARVQGWYEWLPYLKNIRHGSANILGIPQTSPLCQLELSQGCNDERIDDVLTWLDDQKVNHVSQSVLQAQEIII